MKFKVAFKADSFAISKGGIWGFNPKKGIPQLCIKKWGEMNLASFPSRCESRKMRILTKYLMYTSTSMSFLDLLINLCESTPPPSPRPRDLIPPRPPAAPLWFGSAPHDLVPPPCPSPSNQSG